MYGTIARLQLKPGTEAELHRLNRELAPEVPGLVFEYAYRSDSDPAVVFLVIGFTDKAAYLATAASPAQQARYDQFRALLVAEPEWHDGEIPFAYPPRD
jgi:quinol monooxygenase YgiN